ncbi:MAG: ABC transporter permease [Steroidobacteraceae bacterium]
MLKKTLFVLVTGVATVIGVGVAVTLPWIGIGALAVVLALWLTLSRAGRRVDLITASGMSTLPQRWGGASVVVVGIAGVVGVLVSMLAMGKGYESTFRATGSDDTAIVLQSGAPAENTSSLDTQSVLLISGKPQVARSAQGRPLASPEVLVGASLPKRGTGEDENVTIRGVGPEAWAVRKGVKIIAGRRFHKGLRELIAGKDAASEFAHTRVGSTLQIKGQPWKVVGEFDSGDAHDSELWGDVNVVAVASHLGSSVQSVTVRLTGAQAFDAFKAALTSDPQLQVQSYTTRGYYAQQSEGVSSFIRSLGIAAAAVMAIGAVAGALNSMYAAVSARTREIATLRAIGFRGGPVVVSVMIETMLLAIAGGAGGALIAWLLFHHFTASTMGPNFGAVMFQFRVTPQLMGEGLKWALVIGFLGGLFPALRAARIPVTDALREL